MAVATKTVKYVQFDTRAYFTSYLKQPRGYGWWYFSIGGEDFCYVGKYGEAKAAATREAKAKGVSVVYVES